MLFRPRHADFGDQPDPLTAAAFDLHLRVEAMVLEPTNLLTARLLMVKCSRPIQPGFSSSP